MFGAVLAALVVFFRLMVAVYGARRGASDVGMLPLAFMVFPFGMKLMFGGFVGVGLWNRHQPEIHCRLILLGTICFLTPAISRMVDIRSVVALLLTLIFVVVAMIHDWKFCRQVHLVYILGGAIILVSGPLRAAIGNSAAWQSFAQFVVGYPPTSPKLRPVRAEQTTLDDRRSTRKASFIGRRRAACARAW